MSSDDLRPETSTRRRLETLLPRFSLDRRVTVVVLLATLLVLGGVAATTIPVELIPSGYSEPFLRVVAPWRDAPAQEVLDKLTLPLEEELSTVRGLDRMFSFATTGFTQVYMSFKLGTDMDVAYRELRDRVERAKVRMPDDLEQVFIRKHDDGAIPIAVVGLAVEEDTVDVYDLIQNEIVLAMERIDGVANIEINGLEEKEILIELDRERVAASGLNIYQLAQDLARDNFSMASGSVLAGDKKLLLRSVARYRTPASVEDLPISPSIRLGDIATVRYDEPEKEYRVRVNSKPAYAVMVFKEGEANTLEVARRVTAVKDQLQQNPRLQGFEIELIMDQGDIIMESLSTLLDSGRIGAVFAMLVLFFFMRRLRMSLIIALSIPLSMVVALVVMYFAGETLNLLSLLGLMISVGLLVDNSVVVAENIFRLYREEGAGRREACIRGAGEIAMAITTATLTTMVVFLPVALVEGQGQFFLLRLALPISVSLGASLFVALVLIPLSVYLTLPANGVETPRHAVSRRVDQALRWLYDRSFGALNRLYSRLLELSLRHRLELVLVLAAVFGLTQWLVQDRLKVVSMQEDEQAFFEIGVEMPRNIPFEEAEAWFRRAEAVVAKLNEEELDLEFYMLFHRRNWGEIQGALGTGGGRPRMTPRQVMDRIMEELPEKPGLEFHTGQQSENEKEDALEREVLTLYGEDSAILDEVAVNLESMYQKVPGVLGVKKSADRPPNEIALVIDRERAQRQGVDPGTLAGVVSYALRGQPLPRVYLGGRDIPVRVRFEEEDRDSLAQLGSFSVPTASGESLPLSALVDVQQLPSATRIFRRDKRTARRIVLELEDGVEKEARERIRAATAQIDLPEGVSFGTTMRGGNSEEVENLAFAAMLSVVFVYLLMGFLFESFLLPLAILVTVPLAGIGVVWIHLLMGRDLDFLGLVGVIILIGVVVNNGIVLLDYVNRLRTEGYSRHDALILGTERRFRPIMMTALTTICGMVPLTLGGATRIGLSYTSFGLTLIGGMITSSLLTLLVVPVSYTLFEDARTWVGRAIAGALGRAEPPTERQSSSV